MTRDSQEFQMKKKRKIIAGCIFLAIIFFITLIKGGSLFQAENDMKLIRGDASVDDIGLSGSAIGSDMQGSSEQEAVPLIVVDVAGAVSRPGILILPEGSRVYEALTSAGGITANGDLRDINLAEVLMDGEKLYIPSKDEYEAEHETGTEQSKSQVAAALSGRKNDAGTGTGKSGKVNINTADTEQLQTLTGVDPSMAQRILDYRKENGKFKSVQELKNVKGIGEKTFEKLKNYISVT